MVGSLKPVHSKQIGLDLEGSIQLCAHSEKGAKRVQTLAKFNAIFDGLQSRRQSLP
jgi:hypothetical protein